MANNLKISNAARSAAMDAVTALINAGGAGQIEIYDGSQPAGPDTAITTQVVIAKIPFAADAFGDASDGVSAGASMPRSVAASFAGGGAKTASWFRIRANGDSGAAVIDGTVGTSGCDLNLDNTSITSGQTVSISSFSLTHPA